MKAVLYIGAIILMFVVTGIVDIVRVPTQSEANTELARQYVANSNLPMPPKAFTHDGCTLFPDTLLWHDLKAACLQHDIVYWAGGPISLKPAADLEFRQAIAHTGPLGQPIGFIAYVGVRLFGNSPITKALDAHWGYGWD